MKRWKRVKSWFGTLTGRQKAAFVIILVAVIILLLESIAFAVLWVSSVQEGLSIHVEVDDQFSSLPHLATTDINFDIGVQNAPLCTAACSWQLVDPRTGNVIDSGNFSATRGSSLSESTSLRAPASGRFVSSYQLEVVCQNQVTLRCQRDNETRVAIQSLFVNVTLPPEQEAARLQFLQEYPVWLSGASGNLSLLTALATINATRAENLSAAAIRQADELRATNDQVALLVADQNYLRALSYLSEIDAAKIISSYRSLKDSEQQIYVYLDNISLDFTNSIVFFFNNSQYDRYQDEVSSLGDIYDSPSNFSITEIDLLAREFTAFISSLNQSVNFTFVLNQAVSGLNVELASICAATNSSCPSNLSNVSNYSMAVSSVDRVCSRARFISDLQEANAGQIFSTDNFHLSVLNRCLRDSLTLPASPSPTLPMLSASDDSLRAVETESLLCCGALGCGVCEQSSAPIIFVHGHSFSERSAPQYSLQAFTDMAIRFQQDGRLYLGRVFPNAAPDLGGYNFPGGVSASTTYYFDTYQEEGSLQLVARKSEPIDAYSIRLHESIQALKAGTGSERVYIVSHSMGGLVSRRYMQIFGEDSVAGFVMLGTPNGGIFGKIDHLCPVVGGDRECEDMRPNSLFFTKLESGGSPSVPSLSIAGVGCDGRDWDGVIEEDSVRTDWAEHFVVNGTCDSPDGNLHSGMLNPDRHPEVYAAVYEFIQSQS